MVLKRSISPDGRIDSLSIEFSSDVAPLSETEILDRADFLHTAALDSGAHGGSEPIRPLVLEAVESLCADGTLKRHEAGGERFYVVPEERRIALQKFGHLFRN